MFFNFNFLPLQISLARESFQIHHNTLTFLVPPQDPQVVRQMHLSGQVPRVALYRPHDGKYSKTKYEFHYEEHQEERCHFCAILRPTELRKYVRAKKDQRRRVTDQGSGGGGGAAGGGAGSSKGKGGSGGGGGGGVKRESASPPSGGANISMTPAAAGFFSGAFMGLGGTEMANYSSPFHESSSSSSGVYSPESQSTATDIDTDWTMGSPPASKKCRRGSTGAASNSSGDEWGGANVPLVVQQGPVMINNIQQQQQQQQVQQQSDDDQQQLEEFMNEVAKAMSPKGDLPAAESNIMDIGRGESSSMYTQQKPTIPSPTHSPIMPRTDVSQQMQQQQLGGINLTDLVDCDLIKDTTMEGGFPVIDLLEPMGNKNYTGHLQESVGYPGVISHELLEMDGDGTPFDPLDEFMKTMKPNSENEVKKEEEGEEESSTPTLELDEEEGVDQVQDLSRQLGELDLRKQRNGADEEEIGAPISSPTVASGCDVGKKKVVIGEESWVSAMAVGVLGIFLYEILCVSTSYL